MTKSIINEKNIEKADVVLISAAYEKTASSHKGTIHGPKKVIECLNWQIEFFDRKFKANVNDFVKIAHQNQIGGKADKAVILDAHIHACHCRQR